MSKAKTIIDKLESDPDVSLDRKEIEEKIDAKTEEMLQSQVSDMPEEEVRYHAASVIKNEIKNISGSSGFGGGETEEFPILAMGYQYKEGDYFVTENDALLASGIINPSDSPAGYALFIIDTDHGVDLDHTMNAFQSLNTVRGFASKRQVGSIDGEPTLKKGGNPTYLVNSTSDSKFEMVDPEDADDDDPISELPSGREDKREMIHQHFIPDEESFTVQEYAKHKAITNDNGYALAFGMDVKRIRGEVIDSMIFDSGDGVMTITDDSIYSEDDVPEELISDNMRTPGLQVSVSGDFTYGEGSILDVYGYINQRKDGQYVLEATGVIPIIEMEYDGPDSSGSSGTDDDDIEGDTI